MMTQPGPDPDPNPYERGERGARRRKALGPSLPSPPIDPDPPSFFFIFIHRMEDAKKGTGGEVEKGRGGEGLLFFFLCTSLVGE